MATTLYEGDGWTITRASNGQGKGTRLEVTIPGFPNVVIGSPDSARFSVQKMNEISDVLSGWAQAESIARVGGPVYDD